MSSTKCLKVLQYSITQRNGGRNDQATSTNDDKEWVAGSQSATCQQECSPDTVLGENNWRSAMTIDPSILFLFFVFPLSAEIFFAYIFQELMCWERMDTFQRFLMTFIFLCVTFPALILPSMGFVALAGTLFNSLYY